MPEDLEDRVKHPEEFESLILPDTDVVVSLNDLHGNYGRIEQAVEKALEYSNKAVVVMSDVFSHKKRGPLFEKLGLQAPQQVVFDYVSDKLDDEGRQTFQFGMMLEQYGGLDSYLTLARNQMPSHDVDEARQQLQPIYDSFKSQEFQQQLQNILQNASESERQELAEKQQEMSIKLRIADMMCTQQQVAGLVEVMEKFKGRVTWVMNPGNHDSILGFGLAKQMYSASDDVKDINTISGAIEVGDMRFQGGGNVAGMGISSDGMVYGKAVEQLYPHMYSRGFAQDLTMEQVEAASPEHLARSNDYRRIGDVEGLDFLLIHSEFGKPVGFEDKESPFPNIDELGLAYVAVNGLKNDAPIIAGHIHSNGEGTDSLGNKVKRSHDVILRKVNGELTLEELSESAIEGDISYSIEQFKENLAKQYALVLENMEKDVAGKIGPEEPEEIEQAA
jgi:Icc-related predicted phosphoesterase